MTQPARTSSRNCTWYVIIDLKITPSGQTIVKPTALGPVANTDTKLLIYGLFQKGRVLAQDEVQAQLQAGAAKPRRRTTKGRAARSPLAGKLFDETGDRLTPSHTKKKNGQRLRYYVSRRLIQHSGQKDLSGWRLPAPMLEQTVLHLIRQHVDATTFSASLIHTPTMQELASVRRFLDGLCSGSNNDSASAAVVCQNSINAGC